MKIDDPLAYRDDAARDPAAIAVDRKRRGLWRNEPRNRAIALEAQRRATTQSVVVLVENVEHGQALQRALPHWPLLALPPGPTVVDPGPGTGRIVTFAAGPRLELAGVEVLLRADGGVGLPPIAERQLLEDHGSDGRSLLLLDADDRHHADLRPACRSRQRAYAAADWFAPGADPANERVTRFLHHRPGHSTEAIHE
jgi:hypothetical protein